MRDGLDAVALGRRRGELARGLGAARVDAHALERQHVGHGLDVRGRLHARAEHRERRRRPRRASARVATALTAAVRIAVTAEASTMPRHAAVLAVEHDDDALVRVEPAPRILGEDRDGLEPEGRARRPRGAPSSGPSGPGDLGGRTTERSGR